MERREDEKTKDVAHEASEMCDRLQPEFCSVTLRKVWIMIVNLSFIDRYINKLINGKVYDGLQFSPRLESVNFRIETTQKWWIYQKIV